MESEINKLSQEERDKQELERKKKMNFKEAYKLMEEGNKIRRKGWDNKNSFLVLRNGETELFWNGEKIEIIIKALLADTLNDDWEVVEERKIFG